MFGNLQEYHDLLQASIIQGLQSDLREQYLKGNSETGDSRVGMAFALHIANPVLIVCIQSGPSNLLQGIAECRLEHSDITQSHWEWS